MAKFTLHVNGAKREVDALPDSPLLWVLRDKLGLLGTKYACGVGGCGACTVLLDGKPVRSCVFSVSNVGAKKITTIEGLSKDGTHPLQKAWIEVDVPQCGYCQAGHLMAAAALLADNKSPTDEEIDEALTGYCRCGTYGRIKEAIHLAAKGGK